MINSLRGLGRRVDARCGLPNKIAVALVFASFVASCRMDHDHEVDVSGEVAFDVNVEIEEIKVKIESECDKVLDNGQHVYDSRDAYRTCVMRYLKGGEQK